MNKPSVRYGATSMAALRRQFPSPTFVFWTGPSTSSVWALAPLPERTEAPATIAVGDAVGRVWRAPLAPDRVLIESADATAMAAVVHSLYPFAGNEVCTMRLPVVPPLPHRIPGALPGPRPVIEVRKAHAPGLLRRVERGIQRKLAAA